MYEKKLKWGLKNPANILLPIFVFTILEDFCGINIGCGISLLITVFLFFYPYFFSTKKTFNWYITPSFFVILCTTLIVKTIDFRKLNPVAIELVLLFFSISILLLKQPITKIIQFNYRKYILGVHENIELFFKILRITIFIFILHLGSFFIGFFFVKRSFCMWIFQYEELFFLLILWIYFTLKVMWVRKRFEEEEYWPILNDTDAIVGYESKNSVYSLTKTVNPLEKNLHPVIRILVIADNKLLLKKNNTDDFYYPDKWDLSISGHLQYGETYKEGINRLLLKSYKLQIKDHNVHYLMKYTYENQYECQRVFLHYLPVTNSHLQQMDLKNTKLWTSIQIMGDLNSNIFTDKLKKEMILLKELSFPYIF